MVILSSLATLEILLPITISLQSPIVYRLDPFLPTTGVLCMPTDIALGVRQPPHSPLGALRPGYFIIEFSLYILTLLLNIIELIERGYVEDDVWGQILDSVLNYLGRLFGL